MPASHPLPATVRETRAHPAEPPTAGEDAEPSTPALLEPSVRVRRSPRGERCVVLLTFNTYLSEATRRRFAAHLRVTARERARPPFPLLVTTTPTHVTVFAEGTPSVIEAWLRAGLDDAIEVASRTFER